MIILFYPGRKDLLQNNLIFFILPFSLNNQPFIQEKNKWDDPNRILSISNTDNRPVYQKLTKLEIITQGSYMNRFPLLWLPQNAQYKYDEGATLIVDHKEDRFHPTIEVSNPTWDYSVDEPHQPLEKLHSFPEAPSLGSIQIGKGLYPWRMLKGRVILSILENDMCQTIGNHTNVVAGYIFIKRIVSIGT